MRRALTILAVLILVPMSVGAACNPYCRGNGESFECWLMGKPSAATGASGAPLPAATPSSPSQHFCDVVGTLACRYAY